MTRSIAVIALALAAGAAGTALSGCVAPHPAILRGDANSVEVTNVGDVARALPLAQRHCAEFERIPRLVEAGEDVVAFDCVRR